MGRIEVFQSHCFPESLNIIILSYLLKLGKLIKTNVFSPLLHLEWAIRDEIHTPEEDLGRGHTNYDMQFIAVISFLLQ